MKILSIFTTLILLTTPPLLIAEDLEKTNEIRNVLGRCLDVSGGVNANRTNVQIFDCNGTRSQQWEKIRGRNQSSPPNQETSPEFNPERI